MKPEDVTHVLYHAQCPDGFAAAYAAWLILKDKAQYIPVSHGSPPPSFPPDAKVVIVDFSYKREICQEIFDTVHKLYILDHHLSAQKELENLPYAHFDMHRSGAHLAWNYWHPDKELPRFFAYVEDKDLWTWKQPDCEAFTIALASYPFDFEIWHKLEVDALIHEGKILLKLQQQLIVQALERARWIDLCGHHIPIINSAVFRSEIGNKLCTIYPETKFSAIYHDNSDGSRSWSLRSIGEFDVSLIAGEFGGGGHKNASGFTESRPSLLETQRKKESNSCH